MSLPAFAHLLPYWTWRTVKIGAAEIEVLVLVDGTLVVGFESTGADVFAADNARLNKNATALRRALNVLPADGFLQAEWYTGASYDPLIDAFEARARSCATAAAPTDTHADVLVGQRRARARLLRHDADLVQGRLAYFVGQRRALGLLGSHTQRGFARLFSTAKDPQTITQAPFVAEAERLAETAARVQEELASTGSALTPMTASALLEACNRALNPSSCRAHPLRPVDRPEELPEPSTRVPPLLVHRPLSLREQIPLGDLTWTESTFAVDDPPVLHRALSLERLPPQTRPDLLMGVQFRTSTPIRVVSTLLATDRAKLTEKLTRKRNIAHAQASGLVRDVAANVAFSEYERVLETMIVNDQRVFAASVTVIVQGHDPASLDHATREVKDAFSDVGAALTTESGRQLQAFVGSLPGNGYRAPRLHQLTTNNAADLVPYFAPSLGDDEPQLLYHTRQNTLRALSFAPGRARSNNNVLVFGSSGSGKSFNVSCVFEQACLVEGCPLLVIDVQGPELSSYRVLAEALGGSYTALSGGADVSFNPFFPHDEIRVGAHPAVLDDDAVRYMSDLVALMALADLERRPDRALAREIARTAVLGAYAATAATRRTPILERRRRSARQLHADRRRARPARPRDVPQAARVDRRSDARAPAEPALALREQQVHAGVRPLRAREGQGARDRPPPLGQLPHLVDDPKARARHDQVRRLRRVLEVPHRRDRERYRRRALPDRAQVERVHLGHQPEPRRLRLVADPLRGAPERLARVPLSTRRRPRERRAAPRPQRAPARALQAAPVQEGRLRRDDARRPQPGRRDRLEAEADALRSVAQHHRPR